MFVIFFLSFSFPFLSKHMDNSSAFLMTPEKGESSIRTSKGMLGACALVGLPIFFLFELFHFTFFSLWEYCRFFKNWYMMERSTQNPEGAIEVANYVRKYEIFDFDEFLRSTKITKSRPTKGGKRDIPETSTPLRPNTHPTSPNTPSSLLTPSRFAPSPCPSGPSLSLPLTPSTYSNTCFSTPTTSQKEKNFTPGPTSVPSSSSTSSSSSSKLKPCLRNKENAPESSERAQGLEHHVRLATDLKQPNGVLSEEPTPQKSSTGKKKGIHLKRMGLDGFQVRYFYRFSSCFSFCFLVLVLVFFLSFLQSLFSFSFPSLFLLFFLTYLFLSIF